MAALTDIVVRLKARKNRFILSTSQTFSIRLVSDSQGDCSFNCGDDELLLNAAKRQGVYMANYCKQGACGACGSKLISGSVNYIRKIKGAPEQPQAGDEVRPCSLNPSSDLVLEPVAAWKLAQT